MTKNFMFINRCLLPWFGVWSKLYNRLYVSLVFALLVLFPYSSTTPRSTSYIMWLLVDQLQLLRIIHQFNEMWIISSSVGYLNFSPCWWGFDSLPCNPLSYFPFPYLQFFSKKEMQWYMLHLWCSKSWKIFKKTH